MTDIDAVKQKFQPLTSQSGEIRYYIDHWYDHIADIVESYCQNVSPHPDLDEIKGSELWFDEEANLHIDGVKDMITIELIRTAIQSRLLS